MSKRKIHRLNKDWYVTDEYGHTDKILVQKVNELIGVVNHQQEVINDFERIMKNKEEKDDEIFCICNGVGLYSGCNYLCNHV